MPIKFKQTVLPLLLFYLQLVCKCSGNLRNVLSLLFIIVPKDARILVPSELIYKCVKLDEFFHGINIDYPWPFGSYIHLCK